MITLKPKIILLPEDFIAPLWAVVCAPTGLELTKRVPIVWGQKQIHLPVVCNGTLYDARLYDRIAGGDLLLIWTLIEGSGRSAYPGDIIFVHNIAWEKK